MKNNLKIIKELMTQYDRSFYIYEESVISRQAKLLAKNFPQFEFLYSVKANPFAPVIDCVVSNGLGADAASAEEVVIAQKAGLPYEKIIYSTPGKTRKDIEQTMDQAIIVADSYHELILIDEIAKQRKMQIKTGLRINMDYSMDGGKGSSSKFGVDEDTLLKQKAFFESLSNTTIVGIHVHLRSQVLDHHQLFQYYEKVFELALSCQENLGWEMEFINFGGGLGIVYSIANDTPLGLELLGHECAGLNEKYKDRIRARLIVETGRFVVCEAGQYVTRIVDIKESMGTKYLIVEKGLNGFLRPAISELLMAYAPENGNLKACEPLFTVKDAFEFIIPEGDKAVLEEVSIVGSLCTASDVMAKNVILPKAQVGDIVIITKAGSYAYSLSPLLFASHALPLQFYLKTNGEVYQE